MRKQLGLEEKRRNLKPDAVPTLFPKKIHFQSGSISWCEGSLHSAAVIASKTVSGASGGAFRKRQWSEVCYTSYNYAV